MTKHIRMTDRDSTFHFFMVWTTESGYETRLGVGVAATLDHRGFQEGIVKASTTTREFFVSRSHLIERLNEWRVATYAAGYTMEISI